MDTAIILLRFLIRAHSRLYTMDEGDRKINDLQGEVCPCCAVLCELGHKSAE